MSSLLPASPEPESLSPDRALWTNRETLIGALATLIPLFLLNLPNLFVMMSGPTTKLTRAEDLRYAVFTLVASALIEGFFLIAPLYYARKYGWRAGLTSLGFRSVSTGLFIGLLILALGASLIAGYIYDIIVQNVFHLQVETNLDQLQTQVNAMPLTVLVTLIAAAVIAPICEEIFFRGFLLQGLRSVMSAPWAVVLSAFIFAAVHVQPGSFFLLFVLGLLLGALRVSTRSIWPCIALHIANNALGAILSLPLIFQALK